jgi:predicted negative regulator of RcsB-dependent stress response
MAVLDSQEQEQLEAFKAWWKENRSYILAGVLIVTVVMGGWRGWQYYQGKQTSEAAILYEEFTRQLDSKDAKRINDAAAAITDKFAATAYAPRAALLAAQVNEQGKDITRAKSQLQWVIDHASEVSLKDVARLRLASLLLDEKNYADALKLLAADHPASFDGLYADLKGDVLSAQGKNEEARTAYNLALEKTDSKSMYRNLIQMKLDALAVAK